MPRLPVVLLLSLFLIPGAGNGFPQSQALPAGTPESRGLFVARHVEDRDTGNDSRIALHMRLIDRQNRVRERALTLAAMRGGAGRPVDGDRTLVRFTYPNDIKGTGFLVWDHQAAESERFLYLPSLGRVRRIAASESQESFVGSDFTYEDIGGREFDDYKYRLLDDTAVWTGPDGTKYPVYRLESRHTDPQARFPRVVSLVRQDIWVVVGATMFNKRDEAQKAFEVRRVEKIGKYWTVLDMVMSDLQQRTRTELVIEKAEYDVGLKDADFSRAALERGGK